MRNTMQTGNMRKAINVTEIINEKHGSTRGHDWCLRDVKADDGKRYRTFEAIEEPGTYDCEVESEPSQTKNPKTGKPYINWKIVKVYMPSQARGREIAGERKDEAMTLLREIHQMLTDLTLKLGDEAGDELGKTMKKIGL